MQYAEHSPDEIRAASRALVAHLPTAKRIVPSDESYGRAMNGRCLVCGKPVGDDEQNGIWIVVPDRGDAEHRSHDTLGQTHPRCSMQMRPLSDAELALDAARRRVKQAQLDVEIAQRGQADEPSGEANAAMRDWYVAAAEWAAAEACVADERGDTPGVLEHWRDLHRETLANVVMMMATERWWIHWPAATHRECEAFITDFRSMLDTASTETIAAVVSERTAGDR